MYRSREFRRVYLIQVVYLSVAAFSWSFVPFHLVDMGFSYTDLILFRLFAYLTGALAALFYTRYRIMGSVGVGFLGFALILLLMPFVRDSPFLMLLAVLDGLTCPMFFIPYNTLYFGFRGAVGSAFLASLGYLVMPAVGVAAPLLAGFIVEAYGVAVVFLIGAAVLFYAAVHYGRQPGGVLSVDARRALSAGKGLKALLFIQGFWQGVDWICVPLFTLYFLTSGVSYGGFLSYVAVFGAFSTLYFCRVSDRTGNRVNYLYPSIVLTAAATVLSGLVSDLFNWFMVRGFIGFFVAVANPFTVSIVLDRMRNTGDAMYLRHLLVTAGQLAGTLLVLTCHLFLGGFQKAFIFAGLLLFTYPLIVEYKKLYPRRVSAAAVISDETLEFTGQ